MKGSPKRASTQSIDAPHLPRHESEFISALRFLMIAGLTFHHFFAIPNSRYYPRNTMEDYSHFIPDLVNGFVHMSFMAAVPALSVISGYLFFSRPHLDFTRLLKKRFFSLALPSWLWCSMWLGFAYVLVRVGQDHGWFEWANYHFEDFGPKDLINGIVGLDEMPFAFQFWFVHDLILTLLLAPVVHWALQKLDWAFLVAVSAFWLYGYVPPPFFSMNVLFFFCVGAYMGRSNEPRLAAALERLDRFGWYVVPIFALALLVRQFSHLLGDSGSILLDNQYLCVLRVLGVLAFSQVLFTLVKRGGPFKDLLIRYSGYSFFIFAAHFPVIEFVKFFARRVPGAETATGSFLMWLSVPVATIVICIIGAKLLERLMPAGFSILNGGRSGGPVPAPIESTQAPNTMTR